MGKGAVDERHPLSLGVVGNVMGALSPQVGVRGYVREADLVVLVGTRTNENGTDGWKLLPEQATFVHVDVDGREVGRNYPALPLVGDAGLALADLREALAGRSLAHLQAGRKAVEQAVARARAAGAREPDEYGFDGGLTPQRVMAVLDELVDEDTVTVADASYASVWTTYYLTAKQAGQRFLTPRGLAGLGWGLPMALGAQAALGTRRVVCVAGDGGFGHVWAELETAVREQLPVTVVLLHNGTLGFQRHAELVAFDAYTSACDFSPVDHTKVAEAVGARAVTVSDSDELKPVLADALAHRGPVLVEVMTSPHAHPPITGWEKRLSVLADNQAI